MLNRREILGIAGVTLVAGTSPSVFATTYPNKPIRLVCPWPPGGVTDVLARALAQHMASELGQSIVVDNKAGAGGMIGSAEVARAPADGYTLLFNTSSLVQAPLVTNQKLYDAIKDFTPIGSMGRTVMPFVVPASSPANTLAEFVTFSRGKGLAYGTFGPGTTSHAFQQLFSDYNKLDMVHVPYKGEAPMLNDLLAGQIPCAMGTMSTLAPHIKNGKINALALLSPEPMHDFPNLRTFVELGYPPEFDWRGGFMALFGPANLPQEIASRLADIFARILAMPTMQQVLKQAYATGKPSLLRDTAAEVAATQDAWAKLVTRLSLGSS
jgi:tripartite-type tricarboxylate transporter receptor subunit TctC